MTNIEGRVIKLELQLRKALDRVGALETRAATLEQQARQPLAQMWQGGGGGDGRAYWAKSDHTTPFAATTGTWPDPGPSTATLDVYQDEGGTLTLVAAGATVRWMWPDASGTDKLLAVMSNGDGTYDVIAESCSAVPVG